MGFLDFLKGIIPEKLINFEIDNRNIEISNSTIVIGEQKINDPKIIDQVLNKLKEYKEKESFPCQIVHKELYNSYSEYEEISLNQSESIKQLKIILPPEDVECILMVRRVKRAFDKNQDNAKELHMDLEKQYPDKGYKVFNLVGGGYFDEMILPFVEVFKAEYEEKYVEKFREFYNNILKFFPLAFFIGNRTTQEKLREELLARLNLSNVPFIRLHSIGKYNIEKVEKIVDELKIEDNYTVKDDRFVSPNGLKAQIYEIRMPDKKFTE